MGEPEIAPEEGVEIVGPFQTRELVVDGYAVPGVQAIEEDGGRVLFLVDHRMGYSVAAGDFEQVARLVANMYALGLGLSAFPSSCDENAEMWRTELRRVPVLMRPRRLIGITGVQTEEAEPSDDPRFDGPEDGTEP